MLDRHSPLLMVSGEGMGAATQSVPQGVSVWGRHYPLLMVSGEEMGAGMQSVPQGGSVLDRRSPLLLRATRLGVG